MAQIYVCRHGQDMDNVAGILNGHRDEPLSALGKSQAAALAQKVKDEQLQLNAIYTSPLRRAKETAEEVGRSTGVPVVVMADLIERDFGVLTGKPYADIPKYAGENVVQTDKVLYFLSAEGSETFDKCIERAHRVLNDVDARHKGDHVLLVCHGDIGKMLVAARKGMGWRDGLEAPYFANTEVRQL
ncbi:phosphoglycerate mutase [Strigomonas culicis]|nr:phosphoglycerate mutase [Strigomonas culicis]|eukprot:EPY32707.1 phosphoglycerate mutase [Strigomonas culicis]